MRIRLLAAASAALLLTFAGSGIASAHANLIKANIKNNQILKVGHVPTKIVGTFAQDLDPKHSWMAVFEGVADHGLITEKEKSVVNYKSPEHMTLKLPKLAVDKYYLIWYTHSAVDGHYAAGILYFQVKK